MYLHLGKGHMILRKSIICIGQVACLEQQKEDSIIHRKREEEKLIDVSEGHPQSFIITNDRMYLSLISAQTLEKRLRKTIFSGGFNEQGE